MFLYKECRNGGTILLSVGVQDDLTGLSFKIKSYVFFVSSPTTISCSIYSFFMSELIFIYLFLFWLLSSSGAATVSKLAQIL